MKKLDWKSFVIGVLLTTTVMLGTGAATSTSEKLDTDQQWELKSVRVKSKAPEGYEPFQINNTPAFGSNPYIIWRKRIK